MLFARIWCGIWNGVFTSIVPTYQAECSKPRSRGKLLLLSGSLITFVRWSIDSPWSVIDKSPVTGNHDQLLDRPRLLLHDRADIMEGE